MLSRRTGLRVSRSSQDNDLFNFVYYGFTSAMILKFQVEENSKVSKNDTLAILTFNGKEQTLLFSEAGTIQKIMIPQIQSQKKLINPCICVMKACDHTPRLNVTQTALDYCSNCGQVIWYYYSTEIISYSLGEIKKRIQMHNNQWDLSFEWQVIKNEHFTKDTEIAKGSSCFLKLQFTGKIAYLYKSEEILKLEDSKDIKADDTIILQVRKIICRHQKIIDQICQFCLEKIQLQPSFYLFRNNQTNIEGRALHQQQEQYIQNLLGRKKLILILDLDNTILHSIEQFLLNEQQIGSLQQYFIIPQQLNILIQNKILVKLRNHFKQFLQTITSLFDIYIYTKGTRQYAQQICAYIRKQFKEILQNTNYFTPQKMMTRDQDPILYRKMAKCIVPSRMDVVIIVDDRRDVWDCHGHCIFTKEYFHFIKNSEGKIQINSQEDHYLYFASKMLKIIHNKYFEESFNNNTKKTEISRIHHKYKMNLLSSYKVKFILNQSNGNKENNIIRRSKRMGITQCQENQRPHLVIRSNKIEQKQVDLLKKLDSIKVAIVSDNWINLCYEYTFMFDYHKFILEDPMNLNITVDFHHVILQTLQQFQL